MQIRVVFSAIALLVVLFISACASSGETAVITERPKPPEAQVTPAAQDSVVAEAPTSSPLDTVHVGRFDTGKMWTFDNPPVDYFQEAYGFRPDTAWFNHARLGALRFATYCSASFVSPYGLVMTNHHCGRESITKVTKSGEDLLENGFYASSLDAERRVNDLYVDQLIEITDVTGWISSKISGINDDDRRAQVLQQTTDEIEKQMTSEAKLRDTTLYVQVIELYNGGKYSAYTFHRYHDVRLVMAPEEQIAFFGGAADNFTYPRYDLDMSWFRVYGPDGKPVNSPRYFPFSKTGSKVGEAVFVVGNPGSTSRLNTVAQLQFEQQYSLPQQLDILRTRAAILEPYIAGHKEEADEYDLLNTLFSVQNSMKALGGQLGGLRGEEIMLRRRAAERRLAQAIQANDTLRGQYGNVISALEDLQRSKEATANQAGAFTFFGSDEMESHVLLRALYGYIYDFLKQRGAPESQLSTYRKGGLEVKDWPKEVDQAFLAARLRELQRYFGPNDPTVRRILGGRTPEQVAQQVVSSTALTDSAGFAGLLQKGYLSSNDPTVALINAIAPLYFSLSEQQQNFEAREDNLNAKLARARFAISGTQIPPDASFSLRIADGVVKPYPYNGTMAPAYTTMYGVYDRHYSFPSSRDEWDLPQRWLSPPPEFQRSTQLDMVTTNDITGGNSGSPLLNKNLEVVGLVFDSNIEGVPSVYLYTDALNRAVSVDSRGILETLDDLYDADRLVLELTQQQLAETEDQADARLSAK